MQYGLSLMGVVATSLLLSTTLVRAETCPEKELIKAGKLSGEGKSIGFIVGVRWGQGTLTLNDGRSYTFKAKGGKIAEIGASSIKFSGTIYNMKSISDFAGVYSGVTGGVTLFKGLGGASFTNANCVAINIKRTDATGLQGSAPAPGVIDVELVK